MNTIKTSLVAFLVLASQQLIANPLVEGPLKKGISAIVAQKIDQGIIQITELANKYPNFKLAQYIKADLFTYRSGQHFKTITNSILSEEVYNELQARLKDDDVVKRNLYPSEIVYLGQEYAHVLVADISRSRLYVYNNKLTLLNSFYMSIGRAGAGKQKINDGKTPLGTYFVDKRIDGESLPDKYGDAAYTLNYPNAWDKINGKTGYGIWLHGTAKTSYSRVPNATEGCISLANDDLKAIEQYISANTPIIIGNPVKWSNNKIAFNDKEFIKQFKKLNKEHRILAAKNTPPTVAALATTTPAPIPVATAVPSNPSLNTIPLNTSLMPTSVVASTEQVATEKEELTEQLNNVSLINDPEKEMIVAAFLQHQDDKVTRIEQYWKNTVNGWQVVSESGI